MKTKFRFLFILVPLGFVLLGSLVLMALWNWLIPDLFGLGTLTYLQALGILVLVRILTWGGGWFGRPRWHPFAFAYAGGYPYHFHHYRQHEYWRKKMKEKWENLSDEEKEKWKQKLCGPFWKGFEEEKEPTPGPNA